MSDLILGWRLNDAMVPSYWLTPGAKPGVQTSKHLVMAAPKDMAYHTVIVAQSGSGKSFFLGRLLEERTLNTRGKLVVLDPNADFRRIADVVPESWWTSANYDVETGRGRLPHEASRQIFADKWDPIKPQVLSGPHSTPANSIQPTGAVGPQRRLSWVIRGVFRCGPPLTGSVRLLKLRCMHILKNVA